MPKTFSHFSSLIVILTLIGLSVLGCSQQATETPAFESTPEPTATEDFVPVVPKNAEEMVIFSFEENGNAHLFAYIPDKLPLTRLTSGNWSDITPAAQPRWKKACLCIQPQRTLGPV